MIKFRAWSKLASRMYIVNGLYFDRGMVQYANNNNAIRFINLENVILMQSTGLKDKNGKEIFEGDIVKRDGVKRPEVVRFGEWTDVDSLGYKEQYIGFYFESEHEGQEWLHSVQPQFNHLYKVIGNIYENPELLEVEP